MKEQIREFVRQMMSLNHRMLTLTEIYELVLDPGNLFNPFPLFLSVLQKQKIIRTAIYEQCLYRYIQTHTHQYVFFPKSIQKSSRQKYGLIEFAHEYENEFVTPNRTRRVH